MYIKLFNCMVREEDIIYIAKGRYNNSTILGFRNGVTLEISQRLNEVCDKFCPPESEGLKNEM